MKKTSTSSLRLLQANLGSGEQDLKLRKRYREKMTDVDYLTFLQCRNKKLLAASSEHLDVLFLQEVVLRQVEGQDQHELKVRAANVELLTSLSRRFMIFAHTDRLGGQDCVVALRKGVFECSGGGVKNPVNQSFVTCETNAQVAMVTALHSESGLDVQFVSAHIAGFNQDTDDADEQRAGNQELMDICGRLDENAVTVFGMDLNSSILHKRAGILSSRGFLLKTTETHTAEFCRSTPFNEPKLKKRHLDCFAARNVSSLDVEEPCEMGIADWLWNWFDIKQNPSDHFPIVARLNLVSH